MFTEQLHSYFFEYTLTIPFFSLLVAILVKGIVHAIKGRFTISKMLGSGGMPSAHSTFVIALSTAIGIEHGVWSDLFMICLVFSIIIIYDALNVRFQAGLHAKALNTIAHDTGFQFNESIGHTPIEAIVWGIIGFSTAAILMSI